MSATSVSKVSDWDRWEAGMTASAGIAPKSAVGMVREIGGREP
jgi:hypothetical protein